MVEVVVVWGATGGASASKAGRLVELDERGEAGVMPVSVWVGGFCRYGMKERTRCSVTAGERSAHHWLKPSL